MIDQLIEQVAANTNLNADQARTALSGALGLIQKHGDDSKVSELFDAVPGAADLAAEGAPEASGGGGLLGGLMKGLGGSGGAAMSDAMAMVQNLGKDGIQMSDLQQLLPIAQQFIVENVGADKLGEVLKSIPGIGGMLGGGKA